MAGLNTLRKAAYSITGLLYPLIQGWRNLRWRGESLPIALISFDIDYTKDESAIPGVLAELSHYEVQASFACIGRHVENNPDLYRRIARAGHEILNHTYNHPNNDELCPDRRWGELDEAEQREEIRMTESVFERLLGQRSVGFRLPHFGNLQGSDPSVLYPMLAAEGFRYSSSMLDFKLKGRPVAEPRGAGVAEIGITTCPCHPYTAMDSFHVRRSRRAVYRLIHRRVGLLDSLRRSLDLCDHRGVPFNVYLDPLDVTDGVLGELLGELRRRQLECLTYSAFLDRTGLDRPGSSSAPSRKPRP